MTETDLMPEVKSDFITKVYGFEPVINEHIIEESTENMWRILWREQYSKKRCVTIEGRNEIGSRIAKLKLIIGDMQKVLMF